MTSDSAPTVQQLLAFYLEAGVDCALTEAPVNRLSDPDIVPLSSETAQPKPVRTIPAAIPATRGEAAPAPEAAILSARTILISITGAKKRELLEGAIADGHSSKLPIGRVLAEAEQPIDIHWCP